MRKISDENLKDIKGGFSGWVVAAVSIGITFIAGVIDGIARPKKCHN